MSDEGSIPNSATNGGGENAAPSIQVVAQYVKDLSFENPIAPVSTTIRPQVELGVDLQARPAGQGDGPNQGLYEVEMKLRAEAKHEDKPAFLIELVYAGLFLLHNIPDEARTQVLMIEAPHILFPFVRRIVADVIRDGGLPTLMIEPIDFAALYRSKMAEMQQAQTQAPGHLNA